MAGISYERIFSHPVLRTPALLSRLAIRGNLSHGFLHDQTNHACDGYIHHLQLQTGTRRKKASEDAWPPITSSQGLLASSRAHRFFRARKAIHRASHPVLACLLPDGCHCFTRSCFSGA